MNIEKGCYSLLPEAWPCCTATDVDPLNGLLCDKRQWSRNRTQNTGCKTFHHTENVFLQISCMYKSEIDRNIDNTGIIDIIQECITCCWLPQTVIKTSVYKIKEISGLLCCNAVSLKQKCEACIIIPFKAEFGHFCGSVTKLNWKNNDI